MDRTRGRHEPKRWSACPDYAFTLKNGLREASGRFLVGDGNQSNYVAGGEVTKTIKTSQGKGAEYKKYGVIVNCLPTLNPDGQHVRVECQFEISGPGRKNPDLEAWDLDTFQYQAGFVAELGKPLALVDETDRRVQVTVSRAP
ncbi:MAG: hypothetical protein NTY77_07790 [Elusimicrobia bacterium]|nr:hypothetical protein [Elusimicrobiota bacterium]